MGYFYGPVSSKRLGISLGVDVFSASFDKLCTFDCLYCQAGKTIEKTIKRVSCVDFKNFSKQLRAVVRKHTLIDYITISGSGEPTLHKGLNKIISLIKKITKKKYPVCVITNSSLLYRKDVRRELQKADLIIPSLDAACFRSFNKINKPHYKVKFKKIIEGLIKLRKEFKGKIWLEIMFIKGMNDSLKEAEKFKEIIKKIKPDKIQLNLPTRTKADRNRLPALKRLKEIKRIIGAKAEIVGRRDLRSNS